MSPHKLHQEHPVIPVTQPQQEIIIDQHEENGREVGGIVYHPLGNGNGKGSPIKDRIRINEGMGEGAGWRTHNAKEGLNQSHGRGHIQAGGGGGQGRQGDHELRLQRQPHRDTQETGPSPLPLPPAHTATHHPSANHHHNAQKPQPHVITTGGPRLFIQPPTPDNPSPPPALQVRSLNTPNPVQGNINPMNDGSRVKHEGQGGVNGEQGGGGQGGVNEGGGGGMMSRFKTTFLSKNKGPMSKTWARKSYLDELESMAPTSPTSPYTSNSPRNHRSAPVTPHVHGDGGDLESGRQGIRRITDQRELPRARSVYASPIALAQFKALPPMNPQGETMVVPR